MKNKKLLISFSFIGMILISFNVFAYKCAVSECSTGDKEIKHDATIQPTLECTGNYSYAKSWNYTRSSKDVFCSKLSQRANSNKIEITCHNWNTIWGRTHTVNITWHCVHNPPIHWNHPPLD